MNKKTASLAIVALLLITTLFVFSQTSSQFPELDKNGRPVLPRPMPHLVYSPTDLAHSAVVLPASRSEEHTSELQSQFHLVCRLLLEKNKQGDHGDSEDPIAGPACGPDQVDEKQARAHHPVCSTRTRARRGPKRPSFASPAAG